MNDTPPGYVLDTSAWFTLLEDEPRSDAVEEILERARAGEIVVFVSFMTFMEAYYITLQERDAQEARLRLQPIEALPVLRIESTTALGMRAAELKAFHQLSVADAWIAALASQQDATLVHKHPEFDQLDGEIMLMQLPYNTKST